MLADVAIQPGQDCFVEPYRSWSCHNYSVVVCSGMRPAIAAGNGRYRIVLAGACSSGELSALRDLAFWTSWHRLAWTAPHGHAPHISAQSTSGGSTAAKTLLRGGLFWRPARVPGIQWGGM